MAKKGLGKGLSSLISEAETDLSQTDAVVELKLMEIEPNKHQPRQNFDEQSLEELADSIKEHGVLSPILVVRQENGFYRIVAGERRWRAAKMAGMKTIPAMVRNLDAQKIHEIALIENLQRQDLNPIEEARGYQRLLQEFHLTQEEIAAKVSKSRPVVANALRLLALPDALIAALEQGSLSVGHAKVLLSCQDKGKQLMFGKLAIESGLTVRDLERMIKADEKPRRTAPEEDLNVRLAFADFEKRASSVLGTKVTISRGKKKGKIEIEYYSPDDLERIGKILNI